MKKRIAMLLILCMILCLCPLSAWAEEFDITDDAAVAELNHKTYEANLFDAVFSRHESMAMTVYHRLHPEEDRYFWETADCVYVQCDAGTARYDRDRVFYEMTRDEESGALALRCGVDISADYSPLFDFAGGYTEEEIYDPAHDKVLDIYTEDGFLYILTRFDEELSQFCVENDLHSEYEGQTVLSWTVLDPETYEVAMFAYSFEGENEGDFVFAEIFDYDVPEPFACLNLRASFERSAQKPMIMKIVADPGTEQEITRKLVVPANSSVGIDGGGVPFVTFTDPNCESALLWDGQEDASWYVFTNPSDELYEKYFALSDEATAAYFQEHSAEIMEAIIEANKADAILENHDSAFITEQATFRDGFTIYFDENGRLEDYGDQGQTLITDVDMWAEYSPDGETTQPVYNFFAMTEEEWEAYMALYASPSINVEFSGDEEVRSIEINEDGTMTVTTCKSAEDIAAWADKYEPGLPEEYRGYPGQTVYVVDAVTMEIFSIEDAVIRDGEATVFASETVEYDVPTPEAFGKLAALREELSVVDPENMWTVHVVYDAGTEAEESFTVELNQAVSVFPRLRDGYGVVSEEWSEDHSDLTFFCEPVK